MATTLSFNDGYAFELGRMAAAMWYVVPCLIVGGGIFYWLITHQKE